MNREDTVRLCRYVKGACPQQAIDEFTPNIWHDLLGDLRLEDCREAVTAVARRQPFVSPAEIREEVKRIRADRIGPAGPGLSPVPPAADPDDDKAYRAELRAQRARTADGIEPLPAINAAPADPEGNPHARRILAEFHARQDAARRRRAEEAMAERADLKRYRDAVDALFALDDHGAAALAQARQELLGDEQAAAGYPLLQALPGVMDEHRITIHAARLAADHTRGEAS
jgi:hypothetical protein